MTRPDPAPPHAIAKTGRSPFALVTRGVTLLLLTALTAQLSAGDLALVSRSLARTAQAEASGFRDVSAAFVRAVRKLADEERPDAVHPDLPTARLAASPAATPRALPTFAPPARRLLKHADLALPPPARA